jgi:hypothetical protein
MTNEARDSIGGERKTVEMPRPNVWPMVLSLGIVLSAAGVAMHPGFFVAGGLIFAAGLTGWIAQLLPGRGHIHETLLEPDRRARPVAAQAGLVEQLHPGRPGYRFQLPEKVHPISAGVKGGLVGGLVMPIPALAFGIIKGYGIWYPINLLAGMVLPSVGYMSVDSLKDFDPTLFAVGALIHIVNSVVFGVIYGVLLPALPDIPRPVAWGGLLTPLLWTGVSFSVMGIVNPLLAKEVNWPWFIFSQFVFGLAMPLVVLRLGAWPRVAAGICGGLVGGALMALPAVLWSLANHKGFWFPINLLAGTFVSDISPETLQQYHPDWLMMASAIHILLSASFGLLFSITLPKLPAIPSSVAWGGLIMPLLWTGMAFGLMGLVNKVLQDRVEWPWFIVSQFVFGIAAAIVVHRSEQIPIPPISGERVSV